jgi:hypothetical protein
MGIGRFFKSLVDSEVMGEEIILNIQKVYQKTKDMSPHEDPHELLAKTWLVRAMARGINIKDERIALAAMTETYLFSCLRPGANVRALALHLLFQERQDILNQYPKFEQEYTRLMLPIYEAVEIGTINDLYEKYNPNM